MPDRDRPRLLLVDDDALFCMALTDLFADAGVEVVHARCLADARALLGVGFDLVVLDDHLPDGRGIELFDRLRPDPDPLAPVRPRIVVVSAEPELDMAIAALRCRAVDFLTKPIDPDALRRLLVEPAASRPSGGGPSEPAELLDERLLRYAHSDAPVLVHGETGVGKTRLARRLHAASPRATGPFVTVNCGALPETLVESELFGSERGAFTGAATARVGLLEAASGGTFFLDEIAELPLACQAKLLDVIESRQLRRLGGTAARVVDVRFITATHVDLDEAAARGRFRRDLLYRLDVLRVELPPLRARPWALSTIVASLLAELGIARALAPGELDRLAAYPWPGNYRELRNLLQRSAVVQPDGELQPSALLESHASKPAAVAAGPSPAAASAEAQTVEQVALRHMLDVVARSPTRKDAATALGIGESTLRRKLKQAQALGYALPRRH